MGYLKDKVSGMFDSFSENKSVGKMFGSALGGLSDAVDDIFDSITGRFKPQFETEAEAEDALFNEQPKSPPPGSIWESDIQSPESNTSYGEVKMMRNFVRNEFANREYDFGLYYPDGGEAADVTLGNPNAGYEGEMYRGPRSAWSRICSNTLNYYEKTDTNFEGFIMHGVNGFDDVYGFGPEATKEFTTNVLGFDVQGNPHEMEERMFQHRPPPGVTGIDSEANEAMSNGRKTTITITCWSRSQLDYLQPYFFNPGVTIVVEWGWNNYPKDSLIDLANVGQSKAEKPAGAMMGAAAGSAALASAGVPRPTFPDWDSIESDGLVGLWSDVDKASRHIENGRGNYMFLIGTVVGFNYSIREDGGYDCSVELQSIGSLAQDQKTTSGKRGCGEKEEPKWIPPWDKSEAELEKEDAADDARADMEDRDDNFRDFISDGGINFYLVTPSNKQLAKVGLGALGNVFSDLGFGNTFMSNKDKTDLTRGRYFTPNTLKARASYELGFSEKSYYITFGLFMDFVNQFYAKSTFSSNLAKATVFEFTCERTRISAHPNLKSLNGDVLLIPNATSPRRNGGVSLSKNYYLSPSYTSSTAELTNALKAAAVRSQQASNKKVKANDLADALKMSPRDDLFDILATNAIALGNRRHYLDWTEAVVPVLESASKDTPVQRKWIKMPVPEEAVRPFPDYVPGTGGYSGRLKDLFVNTEIIKEAVESNDTVEAFLKAILDQMSEAAGGVWDFNFTAESHSSPNCTTTAIVDRNYTGMASTDERQRGGLVYTFNSHKKHSIVQSMSLSVDLSGEVATDVMGQQGQSDASPQTRTFVQKSEDRLLNKVPRVKCNPKVEKKSWIDSLLSDATEPNKYIVVKSIEVPGETSTQKSGREAAFKFSMGGQGFLRNADELKLSPGEAKIEMVETDIARANKSMRGDKNPKNNINYNGPTDEIELEIDVLGIAGIRILDAFNCTGIPTIYYTRGHFGVVGVKDAIKDNNWTTTITGMYYANSNEQSSTGKVRSAKTQGEKTQAEKERSEKTPGEEKQGTSK